VLFPFFSLFCAAFSLNWVKNQPRPEYPGSHTTSRRDAIEKTPKLRRLKQTKQHTTHPCKSSDNDAKILS
jgi:hypothetical protein